MTALADRVTLLEDQLASNQRDLQTLIRKIREITGFSSTVAAQPEPNCRPSSEMEQNYLYHYCDWRW